MRRNSPRWPLLKAKYAVLRMAKVKRGEPLFFARSIPQVTSVAGEAEVVAVEDSGVDDVDG